ncbi:hypothetical protein SPKIRA_18450 [Sphingomonas paucimobilis]|nr:hypothetical protein SPKIRA_18450 [Sphingomonas paucimobilis]
MKRLQDHGYRVIPVNPQITGEHIHGEFVFRELGQLGDPIDIVDIFRRSDAVEPIVEEAIAIGAKAIWMRKSSRGRRRARRGGGAEGGHGSLSRDRNSPAWHPAGPRRMIVR